MTIIVAAVNRELGEMYMGCDSLSHAGAAKVYDRQPKVIYRNFGREAEYNTLGQCVTEAIIQPMLLGVSGALTLSNLLVYPSTFSPPPFKGDKIAHEWIVSDFVPALKQMCATHKLEGHDKGELPRSSISIAFQGNIFEIYQDFGVLHVQDDYSAIGSGCDYAAGVLWGHSKNTMAVYPQITPLAVLGAVKCACEFDIYCGGEPSVFKIDTSSKDMVSCF